MSDVDPELEDTEEAVPTDGGIAKAMEEGSNVVYPTTETEEGSAPVTGQEEEEPEEGA